MHIDKDLEQIEDPYIRHQTYGVGAYERIGRGLREAIEKLKGRTNSRGRPSKDTLHYVTVESAKLEEQIVFCEFLRMECMRNIGMTIPAIATMLSRSVEYVEDGIRQAQYDHIPSGLIPVIKRGSAFKD